MLFVDEFCGILVYIKFGVDVTSQYDTETGLYYLQSRYYDPVVGRFINQDSLLGSGGGSGAYNMFLYCGNNPVNLTDPSGTIVITVSTAIVILDIFCITAIAGVLTVGLHQAFAAPLPQTKEKPHFTEIIPFPNNNQQPKNKGKVDPIVPPASRPKPSGRPSRPKNTKEGMYYIADIYRGDPWTIRSGPLTANELFLKLCIIDAAGKYGKNAKWGFYTPLESDARLMMNRLSGGYIGPEGGPGEYMHYHSRGHLTHLVYNDYKHFHGWFG